MIQPYIKARHLGKQLYLQPISPVQIFQGVLCLDLLHQLIIRILSNLCNQRRIVHGNMLLRTFLGSL